MIKYKYRIKTKEEFENEFGRSWRSVRCSFSTYMDYLLGKDIPKEYYIRLLVNGRLDLNKRFTIQDYSRDDGLNHQYWEISEQMIKEVRTGIDYNEKKKLIYD